MYLYPNTTSPREYVPFNSEIVLSCDTGISISKSNSDKRKCLKTGNFDKTDLICTGNCQIPIVQNGFYSTNSQRFVNGTVSSGMYIYLHCNDGYELKDQRQSLKCDADSLFVSTHPSCEEIKCNNLPSRFSNGFYTPPIKKDTFSYNFTFVPVCKTGFTLVSEQNRTCISKNKWSGSTPSCTQVTCQVPILSNGYYLSKKKLAVSLPTFETIQPYCHTGYLLTRSENLTCQEDGQFSRGNFECRSVTCSSFGKLENGILHYSDGFITHQDADIGKNYRFGVKVRASCIPGFHLTRGSTEQTCTENGT
ncbi:sushi, von Willebrand factor type A, EGF and pentraxin domain-containing protein 1-like [Mya arenaria]|nr:sushi, von Willebrand factor type A, EGF and pentraxin domain-containing protein 1-like [Mya arenaria]